jgi:hypothetical protein
MDIKLFFEDKEKTFVVPFVKGRMFRRVLEIYKDYDLDHLNPETLDILVDFIVECFQNQFTRDDFYDGVAADQMTNTILDFINKIAGIGTKGKSDPNLQGN